MSHGKVRSEKNCENCNAIVPERFCSHCGQENIETRQPFYFLITHFIEDFVHYDNSFWQTIRKLFLKPGELTLEYLSGKRNSSVNPVKMYIFISFITFLILAIFPSRPTSEIKINAPESSTESSTVSEKIKENLKEDEVIFYENVFEKTFIKPLYEKDREIKNRNVSMSELSEKLFHNFLSLVPKALFLYMPFFAFLLWLVYDKKRWWYFDHGIFTLHYFSMLLLVTTLISILNNTIGLIDNAIIHFLLTLIKFSLVCYTMIYFYLALKKIYKQRIIKTFLKGTFLIWVNGIFVILIVIALFFYLFFKL